MKRPALASLAVVVALAALPGCAWLLGVSEDPVPLEAPEDGGEAHLDAGDAADVWTD